MEAKATLPVNAPDTPSIQRREWLKKMKYSPNNHKGTDLITTLEGIQSSDW